MMTRRTLFLLLAAALSTSMASAQSGSSVMDMEVEVTDGVYEDVSSLRQHRRELYSFGTFSFSSLLFSLHMCDVDPTCPNKAHRPPINPYCPGCPNCNKISGPRSEEWLKGWCASQSDGSSSAADGEAEQYDSASDADVATNGAGGQPSAARTMNWLIFAAAAGVAITALVAAAMRKRHEEGDGMKATDPNHLLTGSIAKRMMGGMGLATLGGGDENSTIVTEENTLGTNFISMDHQDPVSDSPSDEDAPAEQGIEIDEGEPIVPGSSRYQV